MDSYVIRVYRRSISKSGNEIAGLVEEVGTDQRKAFQTLSGLISTIRQLIEKNGPEDVGGLLATRKQGS